MEVFKSHIASVPSTNTHTTTYIHTDVYTCHEGFSASSSSFSLHPSSCDSAEASSHVLRPVANSDFHCALERPYSQYLHDVLVVAARSSSSLFAAQILLVGRLTKWEPLAGGRASVRATGGGGSDGRRRWLLLLLLDGPQTHPHKHPREVYSCLPPSPRTIPGTSGGYEH